MTEILIQVLICGLSTAAICRTIAYYDGPFRVIPRFKRSLLPILVYNSKKLMFEVKNHHDLMEKFNQILMASQEDESVSDMWKTYHTLYNPKFYLSFRGTLYDVLDCPFCMGPYVSALMALVASIYVYYSLGLSLNLAILNFVLVATGSYGIHFLISKRWESSE